MATFKRIFALTMAVLCVIAFANNALAMGKLSSLKGEVVSVDVGAKTVTVKAINGTKLPTTLTEGQLTFTTDHMTKISMGRKHEGLGDLKAGDMVLVKYHSEDGKNMAASILVTPHYASK
jgi:hypothetical protein